LECAQPARRASRRGTLTNARHAVNADPWQPKSARALVSAAVPVSVEVFRAAAIGC
jgi:hypothetical protein